MKVSRRDHLVEVAKNLFYKHGFRAVGIDTVLEESGVAKKTLYNHFKSKDELIIATLQRREQQWLESLRARMPELVMNQASDPRLAKVLSFFDALDEWINSDFFYGCMFINASAEYPRQNDPIHVVCASHKKLVAQFIEELIAALELKDPHSMAQNIALVVDGAITAAHTSNNKQAAKQAKHITQTLLEPYLT